MTSYVETVKTEEKEKKLVALSSVLAAIFITAFKLTIGLLTHSLGILAEAAHSALDLVAAAVTFFAVRISGRAPDEKLMFGYGKVENLSALFETFLLLVTCVWIIYEAVQRLFFEHIQVEVSIWSFIVMFTSILIDVSRSRALMKAAKKHGSQALEADALHFSTDVWSSAVVIGGLILITLGSFLQKNNLASDTVVAWLNRADAIAALGVSLIVIYVSYELGKRTIEGLLDRAPAGLQKEIVDQVSQIPGLLKIRQIRIRPSGPSTFVDMILEIPRSANFEEAHQIGVQAKEIVKKLVKRVDVIIHMDPMIRDQGSLVESVQSITGRNGLRVHGIRINEDRGKINLDMHIEVPESDTITTAHTRVDKVEEQLREENPDLGEISSHIEPLGDSDSRHTVDVNGSAHLHEVIRSLIAEFPEVENCHNIIVNQEGERYTLSLHCNFPSTIGITEAHRVTVDIERRLHQGIPELDRIYIHQEPSGL